MLFHRLLDCLKKKEKSYSVNLKYVICEGNMRMITVYSLFYRDHERII